MKKELQNLERAENDYAEARVLLDAAKFAVGQKIREIRKDKGLTFREIARMAGVSAPTLYDVELGRRFLSPEKLAKVVKALTK